MQLWLAAVLDSLPTGFTNCEGGWMSCQILRKQHQKGLVVTGNSSDGHFCSQPAYFTRPATSVALCDKIGHIFRVQTLKICMLQMSGSLS